MQSQIRAKKSEKGAGNAARSLQPIGEHEVAKHKKIPLVGRLLANWSRRGDSGRGNRRQSQQAEQQLGSR
jgi:hypothetical protein